MTEVYQYKAWDQSGNVVTGTIEATHPDEAAAQLRVRGYFPSSVTPAKERRQLFQRVQRIKPKELSVFCRQFAIMIETGMPVVSSLQILAAQQGNPSAKQALEAVRRQVSGGESLADSLERHAQVFPQMFLDMVDVGEASGNLAEVLHRLAEFYQKDAKLRGDIKQAMTYPTVIILFALAVIGLVMFFVLPIFADIFSDFGVELPLISRIVLIVRDFIVRNIFFVVALLIAAVFALRAYIRSDRGRRTVDGLMLRVPVIGDLISKIIFTRFARTLSLLFVSGFPIVQSLASCEKVVGNKIVAEDLALARIGVQRGRGITEPLRKEAKAFPPMLIEMMSVGEETGGLDKVLEQVADFYDVEVEHSVKSLTSIVEPLIMVLLGGIIFLIVLSVFVPMFNMANVIQ